MVKMIFSIVITFWAKGEGCNGEGSRGCKDINHSPFFNVRVCVYMHIYIHTH